MNIRGTGHDDTLTGTSGNDDFLMSQGGNDTVSGGDGNDVFRFGAALTAADRIDGGNDSDTVILTGDYSSGLIFAADTMVDVETLSVVGNFNYSLTTDDTTVAGGATLTVKANGLGAGHALIFDGSAETDGHFRIAGSTGDDTLTGGVLVDVFRLENGGNDTVHGGGGNDLIYLGAALTAADQIDGGSGLDTVYLDGAVSTAFAAATMTNVESLVLGSGHAYALTTADATVAAGAVLTVDASAMGASNSLTFNGAAETDGDFTIIGGAGNDVLTGGALADMFDLTHGGRDKANGGGGNDTFNIGGTLTASDLINGGAGNDTLVLDGDYAEGLTLGSAIQQIETLKFTAGHDYNLTTTDVNVAIHATLTVDASALGAGDTASFFGTAETNGAFAFIGGLGANFFLGGSGADQFHFAASAFNEGTGGGGNDTFTFTGDSANVDQIDGGSGTNTLVFDGNYVSLNLTDTAVANIENVAFAGGHSYSVTISGDISAAAATNIDASALLAGDSLSMNASGASNAIVVHVGAASYTIAGSGWSDTFDVGAGFTGLDYIDGGAGNDTLALVGDFGSGSTFGFTSATITGIDTITLARGHTYNFSTSDDVVAAGETLKIDGSALGTSDLFLFAGSGETDGSFYIVSHTRFATLTVGAGDDTFDLGAALGNLVHVDGGAGNNTVILDGDYLSKTSLSNLAHIATVKLTGGHSYNLGGSSSSTVQVIDASGLGAGDTLTLDAQSLGAGTLIKTGAGADRFSGSHNGCTFSYLGTALSGDTRDTFDHFGTHDKIQFHTVNAFHSLDGGTLNSTGFDGSLAAAIGPAQLHAGEALVFSPTSGDLAGHIFLIVDGNGVAGYQAGSDLVIDSLDGFTGLSVASFIG